MNIHDLRIINEIMSDWHSMPIAVKEDVLCVYKEIKPLDYDFVAYKDFVHVLPDSKDAIVTNKFKKLKNHLFGI